MQSLATPRSVALPCRRTVACQAKPTVKMADALLMKPEEIDSKVQELKRGLFDLRMKQATRQTFNAADVPMKRKDVARLLTAKRQQEIANGINLRESRRREVKKLADAGEAF